MNIRENRDKFIAISNSSNSNLLYQKLAELVTFTGSRHKVILQLHFPNPNKLKDIDSYGSENISIVIDKFRKKFVISKEILKINVTKFLGANIKVKDAYAYEGKEGLRVICETGRIELLPGSILLWCKVDCNIMRFLDWMMEYHYFAASGPATFE